MTVAAGLKVPAGLAGEMHLETPIVLLGFGNRAWRDDGAGSILAERLGACAGLTAIDGGMVPENYLEQVAEKKPRTILLADTAELGLAPGECRIVAASRAGPAGVSTHAGSPRTLAEYLAARTGAAVYLLGIQPGDVSSGEGLSGEMQKGIEHLVQQLTFCGSGFFMWERLQPR